MRLNITFSRCSGLVARLNSVCLWIGFYRGPVKPVAHPEGRNFRFLEAWREDGESYLVAGPWLLSVGRAG